MLESILEPILTRTLGNYIENFSKDQMSIKVWSGDVNINNVVLKSSLMSDLGMPFELRFGMIESLRLKIPWKSLATTPVEVILHGLYAVVVPKDQSSWDKLLPNPIAAKHKALVEYTKHMISTITERLKNIDKEKGKEADQGYFALLIEKVIDNLIVNIKNIHIRLESTEKPFENLSFGLTLNSLAVNTCDANWKTTFVDRTLTKSTQIYKKLLLNNFYVYWNSKEEFFMIETCKTNEDYIRELYKRIKNEETQDNEVIKKLSYFFNFSTDARMLQHKISQDLIKNSIPQYDLNISLEDCKIELSKEQINGVNQVVKVIEDFTSYIKEKQKIFRMYRFRPNMRISDENSPVKRKELIKKWWQYALHCQSMENLGKVKTGGWLLRSVGWKQKMIREFEDFFFTRVMTQKNPEAIESIDNDDLIMYENIIMSIDDKELNQVIEEHVKNEKSKAQLESMTQKSKGFFSGWFGGGKNDKEDPTEVKKKLDDYMKTILTPEDQIQYEIPQNYSRTRLRFEQKKFNINLVKNDLVDSVKDKIMLETKDLQVDIDLKLSGMRVSMGLKGLIFGFNRTEFTGRPVFTQQVLSCETEKDHFLKLRIEDQPPDKPGLDKLFEMTLGSLNYIHSPEMLTTLIEIFKNDALDDELTDRLKEQAEMGIGFVKDYAEENTKRMIESQTKILFTVLIKSPQLILPIRDSQDHSLENYPCWIFYPGNLKVQGDSYTSETNKFYDKYTISLLDMQFVYCSKIQIALDPNLSIEQLRVMPASQNYSYIFKNFNIDLSINKLKHGREIEDPHADRLIVGAKLNALSMKLTNKNLSDLKNITNDIISKETDSRKKEKREIFRNSVKSGYVVLKMKEKSVLGSEKDKKIYLFAVFCKDKLYLYRDPRDNDPARYIINFRKRPEVLYEPVENSMTLRNEMHTFEIKFDSEVQYKSWHGLLSKAQTRIFDFQKELEMKSKLKKDEKENKVEKPKANIIENTANEVVVNFVFENLLIDLETLTTKYQLSTSNCVLELTTKNVETNIKFEIYNFYLLQLTENSQEYIITSNYEDSQSKEILQDNYVQDQQKLIIIRITNKASQTDINASFGSLFATLEPTKLKALMMVVLEDASASKTPDQTIKADKKEVLDKSSSFIDSSEEFELSPALLEEYNNNSRKYTEVEKSPINLHILLRIEGINVLFINQITLVPQSSIIIQDSIVDVTMHVGAIVVSCKFNELKLFDLTNYPNTLVTPDIPAIKPALILGKDISQKNETLIDMKCVLIDPLLFNVPDDFATIDLNMTVQNIQATLYLQVIMRNLSFVMDQLLPVLSPGPNPQTASQPKQISNQPTFQQRRTAYINLYKPFWPKLSITVNNTKCLVDLSESEKMSVMVNNMTISNQRTLNKERLFKKPSKSEHPFEGVWVDEYVISIGELALKQLINLDQPDPQEVVISSLSMGVKIEMLPYEKEMKLIFGAIPYTNNNQSLISTIYNDVLPPDPKDVGLYEPAMKVAVQLHPSIFFVGNKEFGAMLLAIKIFTFNDFKDKFFIKDFERKQAESVPQAMFIEVDIANISVVTIDNSKKDLVNGKLYLKNLNVKMISFPKGESDLIVSIGEIKGYSLIERDGKFYEKGFIGDLFVSRIIEGNSPKEIKEKFLNNLLEQDNNRRKAMQPQELTTEQYANLIRVKAETKEKTGSANNISQSQSQSQLSVSQLESSKPHINVRMNSTPSENIIKVEVANLVMVIETGVLLKIIPSVPEKEATRLMALQQEGQKMQEDSTKKIKLDLNQPKSKIDISVVNNSFFLPSLDLQYVVVTDGDIFVNMDSYGSEQLPTISEENYKTFSTKFCVAKIPDSAPPLLPLPGLASEGQPANAPNPVNQGSQGQASPPPETKKDQVKDEDRPYLRSIMGVKLQQFQIFICKYADWYNTPKEKIQKRPMLLPINGQVKMNQYCAIRRNEEAITYLTINSIFVDLQKIHFKLTMQDTDLLMNILNYHLKELEKNTNAKKPAETNTEVADSKLLVVSKIAEGKSEAPRPDALAPESQEVVNEVRDSREPLAQSEIQLGESDFQGSSGQAEDIGNNIKNRRSVIKIGDKSEECIAKTFNFISFSLTENFMATIINDHNNIFAPILSARIGDFGMLIDMDNEMTVYLNWYTEAFYFNNKAMKWEPIIERAALNIEYKAHAIKEIRVWNEGKDKLNINVSIMGLQRLFFMTDALKKMAKDNEAKLASGGALTNLDSLMKENLEKTSAAKPSQQAINYISPIKILNTTGYDISVVYYVKKVEIDERGKPSLKKIHDTSLDVKNGEEVPLGVEENFDEGTELGHEVSNFFNYKFVSCKIKHPFYTIDKISGMSLLINNSKKVQLSGKEKHLLDFKILFNSRTNKDLKEIQFSSSVKFENQLHLPINLIIKHPQGEKNSLIEPKQCYHVPFDHLDYLFDMVIDGDTSDYKGKLDSFLVKDSGYYKVVKLKNSVFNFILKIFRDNNFYYLTHLVALPALSFRNNLPVPISLTIVNKTQSKEFSLDLQEQQSFCDFDIGDTVYYSIQVRGFKTTDKLVLLEEGKVVMNKVVELKDGAGMKGYINLIRMRDSLSHYNFCFYCDVVVINESGYDLEYRAYSNKKNDPGMIIGGRGVQDSQNIAFLSSQKTSLEVKLKTNNEWESTVFSNVVSTQGVGNGVFHLPVAPKNIDLYASQMSPQAAMEFIQKSQKSIQMATTFIEIGFSLRLHYIDEKDYIASKIVLLTPKNILLNNTEDTLDLFIEGKQIQLKSKEKIPLNEFKLTQKKAKVIKFIANVVSEGKVELFESLDVVNLNQAGTSFFLLQSQTRPKEFKMYRIEITIENDYYFLTFNDETGKKDLVFTNKLANIVRFQQVSQKGPIFVDVLPGESIEFSFVNSQASKAVSVIILGDQGLPLATIKTDLIQLVTLKHSLEIRGAKTEVETRFFLQNKSRHFEIRKVVTQQDKNKSRRKNIHGSTTASPDTPEVAITNIDVIINSIGISLIGTFYKDVVEFFFIYINKIRFIGVLGEKKQEVQLLVDYINIDSNYSRTVKYPVLLTTSKSLEKITNTNDMKFLNFHAIINPQTEQSATRSNVVDLDVFELNIMPLAITTDFSIVNASVALINQINELFENQNRSDYLAKYFVNQRTGLTDSIVSFQDKSEWEKINFRGSDTVIYCREFKVSNIKFIVTFTLTDYKENQNKEHSEDINVDLLVKTLGVTFLNIDESPISITGLKLEHVFCSQDAFLNILKSHLMDQQRKNALKIVGSLDIIGNPMSLFSNIGSGVIEFFEKPVEGFVKGPYEGFVGIASGSTSLVKNTAAGAFNTVSRFTNSLGSGFAALSMDSDYMKNRNVNRANKPQNAIEGVGKGLTSLGKGVFSGITGIITQPVNEVKKSGAHGIFKGMLKGVTGVVTKPLAGIFDATSQTAEGIKKTITVFDDKANEHKQRIPRIFYSSYRFFKEYQEQDAYIMRQLKLLNNRIYENEIFLDSVKIKNDIKDSKTPKENIFLVFTNEHMLILDSKVSNILLSTEITDLKNMESVSSTQLNIYYYVNGDVKKLTVIVKPKIILKIIDAFNYCRFISFSNFSYK